MTDTGKTRVIGLGLFGITHVTIVTEPLIMIVHLSKLAPKGGMAAVALDWRTTAESERLNDNLSDIAASSML